MDSMERTPAKVAALNIVAVIAGIITMIVVNIIMLYICSFLMNIPFLVTILSFPSTPQLYMTALIDFAIIGCGYAVCDKLAVATKAGRKPAISFVGLYCLFSFGVTAYSIIVTRGFCDIFIVNVLAAIFSIGMIALGFQKEV